METQLVVSTKYILLICAELLLLLNNQVFYIVKLGSRLGPVQLHVNSKSFNVKVYFKSLRDLDLELEAIIAMPPPPTTQETFLSRIILKSLHV